MTRTSMALKRLGVAGLVAVTVGAGLPALVGATAQAAGPATQLTLSSPDNTGAAGSCVVYQATAKDTAGAVVPGATITVTISDSSTSNTQDVNFCTDSRTVGTTTYTPQSGTISADAPAQTGGGGSDTASFTADANGVVTFGVTAIQPGSVNVRAFLDQNGSKSFSAGEPTQTDTATFTAGGAPGSNANQDAANSVTATPPTDTAVVGETRNFIVTVLNTSNDALKGVIVSYQSTPPATGQAQTFPKTDCGSTDNNGQVTCKIPFTAVTTTATGPDDITFFVNQTDGPTSGPDFATEPTDSSAVTVVAAPTGLQVTLSPDNRNVDFNTTSATYTATVSHTSSTTTSSTSGTLLSFTVSGGSGDETVTKECATGTSNTAGDSSCVITVSDPTPVSGEVLTITATIRGTSNSDTATLTFTNLPADARNIVLSPKTQTVNPGTGVATVSAKVTDANGSPVPNVNVVFTENGPGRFINANNGADSTVVSTNAQGVATAELSSLAGESGTTNVTASIANQSNQCTAAAGKNVAGTTLTGTQAGAKAGNCSDTATVTFGTASPSQSPGARTKLTLSTSTPDIQPNQQGILVATGTPGQNVTLRCYSRPSVTYFDARPDISNSNGTVEFRILPGTNTRCFVKYVGTADNDTNASPSVVINVHTTLSLSTVRTGVRQYIFQGRNLPRRAGQLITLYRITSSGQEIRTSNLKTDASGIYRVTRTFTGSGTFRFRVRTSQTLTNAPGASNIITVNIH